MEAYPKTTQIGRVTGNIQVIGGMTRFDSWVTSDVLVL